ncbi:hypothetical protein MLD38_028471 [Melastoma candidum]|uniref:Uncharacterized protein n=1 Tax=Melastoma candidum TaxID=119954 RepID=A0ACB9N2G1_9MYRT|nr:hypothetical protein MLD38_028471 [Melastoma candidum]
MAVESGGGGLTLFLVNIAAIMERADESILPGVYKEVGAELNVGLTALGSLTLFRSIVQSLCYPLAAYMAMYYNRAHVIALGAFLWAAATFLVGLCTTFLQVAIARGLNGIGLALVAPAIQSLVADCTDETNRGIAFGWLQLTGNLGSIIGTILSVSIAPSSFFGIPGWRIAFHLVGLISVLVGISVRLFADDPQFHGNTKRRNTDRSLRKKLEFILKDAKSVVRIPSFQIIVAQGVWGSFPGSALSFSTLWLELIGFSHGMTAVLSTIFIIGRSLGGLFGGRMGDILAQRLPNAGRIILSQISSGSMILSAAVLLLVLPDDPSTAFSHGLVFFIMGFCASWNAPATNNPIFAEIVPVRSRTSIYALDRSFESILASTAPPVVGLLVQHVYSYKPIQAGSSSASAGIKVDQENAASLGKALYTAIGIPVAVCCFIYSFLYSTYPRDRERARMHALIESETERLEEGDGEACQGEALSDLKASVHDKNIRRVIEVVDYEKQEVVDLDLDDEDAGKSLLLQTRETGK